jgi:peptidyl-tRNA hydrolase, PTH1 family
MKLIVGLGNPGEKYDGQRHNLGFHVIEELRKKLKGPEWTTEKKFKSAISKVSADIILVQPQTYMNVSGLAVSALRNFYKVEPEEIVIIHDELDLPVGHMKMRLGGAAAGHHGVESIINSLGTDKFVRVRLGIGTVETLEGERHGRGFIAEHFVTDSFLPKERSQVKSMIKKGVEVLKTYLEDGLEKAQNQFN